MAKVKGQGHQTQLHLNGLTDVYICIQFENDTN